MKPINIKLIIPIVILLTLSALAGFTIHSTLTKPTPFPTRVPPQTPSAAVAAAVKDSIFGNSSCALPCWQGIVPGITTRDEALTILRDSPLIQGESLLSQDFAADPGGVGWDWRGSISSLEDRPNLGWSEGIVREITIFPPSGITVEEMINGYGIPERVSVLDVGIPEDPQYGVSLYYAHNGFEVRIFSIVGYHDAELKPSDPITFIVIFEPLPIEEYLSSFGFIVVKIPEWRGYGNLQDLYGQ